MKKILTPSVAYFVMFAAVLVIGFLPQNSYAVSGTISDSLSCSGIGGIWTIISSTCTISSAGLAINSGETLTIANGVTLANALGGNGIITINSGGTLTIDGSIDNSGSTINNSGGTINNNSGGTIHGGFGVINNAGTLNNSGVIDDAGGIINNSGGTINNFNAIRIFDDFSTHGTINNNSGGIINNSGAISTFSVGNTINNNSGGTINNSGSGTIGGAGILTNSGTITNLGTISNFSGGSIITNSGTVTNSGTISNKGTVNNNSGGIINNAGIISNLFGTINNNSGGTINNNSGGTINSFAGIINHSNITNSGTINNICTSTFSGNPVSGIAPTIIACLSVSITNTPFAPTTGTPVSLGASVTGGLAPFSYQWFFFTPLGSTATLSGAASPTPTFTPDVPGTYSFNLSVTDSLGVLVTTRSSLTVNPPPIVPPTPPTITAPNVVTAGKFYTASLTPRPDMTYTWTVIGGSVTGSANGPSIQFTAVTDPLTLSATEKNSAGDTATGSKTITVVPVPVAPTITGANSVTAGTSYTASVIPRAGMTYFWTVTGGPFTGLTDPTAATITIVPTPPTPPTDYMLSVTETNLAGDSATGSKTITVVPLNNPPVFIPPPPDGATLGVSAGQVLSFDVKATDPDSGDLITLGSNSLPSGATFPIPAPSNPVSSKFSWTPTTAQVGTLYQVKFTADDGRGGISTITVNINVTPPPLSGVTISNTSPNIDNPIQLSATPQCGSSGCGLSEILSYQWSFTSVPSGSGSAISNPSSATPSFVPDLAGQYVVQLVVSDPLGDRASATDTITVNKAPTTTAVSSSVNPSVSGQSIAFTATVSSAGGTPTGTVQFVTDGINFGSPVTVASGAATSSSSTTLSAGTHSITAVYSGDSSFSTSTSSTLTQLVFPSISITDVSAPDGSSATNFVFTVSLSAPSTQTVTVDFATADGTAKAGAIAGSGDYDAISGKLTFPPLTTTKTITVTVNGDTIVKPDKTFFVNLSNPTNSVISKPQGVGTILNDDFPKISINDVTAPDGSSGMTPFIFTVSLNMPSFQDVTVDFATADGTATAAKNDYMPTSGKVTFPAGMTTESITVFVKGDTLNKPDKTFFVNLSNAANAGINKGQGIGTILNDDPLPALSISDVTVAEPASTTSTTTATFTVNMLDASSKLISSGQTVIVNFATADGTAKTGTDYVTNSGTLIFSPGENTKTINIQILSDPFKDPTETFFVKLTNPTNAVIGMGTGTGTIINPIPTTTSLSSSQIAPKFGQQIIFTATVSPTLGSGIPTGTVTFFDGGTTGTQLGVGTLDASGKASITTAFSFGESHTITAVYSGDNSFTSSIGTLTQLVNKFDTTTSITSSMNPSLFGQAITFTAMVSSTSTDTPTGIVTFVDGTTTLGTGVLDSAGDVTFTTSLLLVGSHSITASYGGDGNFATSTSALIQLVKPIPPVITTPVDGAFLNTNTPTVSGTAGGGTKVTVTFDGAAIGNIDTDTILDVWSIKSANSIPDGPHIIKATAEQNGVQSDPSKPVHVTIDTTPPTVSITSPSDNPAYSTGSVDVVGTMIDDTFVSSATIAIDGGTLNSLTLGSGGSFSFTDNLSPGIHKLVVQAIDAAGNIESAIRIAIIDDLPPKIAIDLVSSSNANAGIARVGDTITIRFTASDDTALKAFDVKFSTHDITPSCNQNPSSVFTCTYLVTALDAAGSAAVTITATDVAGNISTLSKTSMLIDNAPPHTSILSAVDGNGLTVQDGGTTLALPMIIQFKSTDDLSVSLTECAINKALFTIWQHCTSPIKIDQAFLASQGINVPFPLDKSLLIPFIIRSTDIAGNIEPTPASFTFTIITPAQGVQQLINLKESMNLDKGITNSLDAKLQAALNSLNSGNHNAAKNQLNAFINEVNAQTGKKVTKDQATLLIDNASSIQLTLENNQSESFNTLTNIQNSKHDVSMAAIQNTR